jgi:hypothetical protein
MPANTAYVESDIQRTAIFTYDPHTDRFVAAPEVAYGHDMLLEWQDLGAGVVKPIYVGTSADEATATSSPLWTITRFDWTYTSGVWKPTQIRVRLGAWDNRTSLGW